MKKVFRKYLRPRLIVKIALAVVYSVVGAELFLRILVPQPILPRYVCATRYGIRGNEPNRNYWHSSPEYHINIRTNSKGIRADTEIPYEKPAGTKRIVLLGDSFGMGYEVDLEDTFSEQLRRCLETSGIRCEIVNLSVSGHSTAEELITLKEEGLKYNPDLVLLAWHFSDYEDNVRADLFRLEGDVLIRASQTYLPGVKISEFLFRYAAYRFMAEHSHLYSYVRENFAYLVKYKLLPAIRGFSRADKPPQDVNENAAQVKAEYQKKLAIALLEQIKQECASHGAKFLIFDIPIRESRAEFKSSFPDFENEERPPFNVFSPVELLEQQNGKKLYWEKSHGHFTPLGCRIVGEGLAKVVLELL